MGFYSTVIPGLYPQVLVLTYWYLIGNNLALTKQVENICNSYILDGTASVCAMSPSYLISEPNWTGSIDEFPVALLLYCTLSS